MRSYKFPNMFSSNSSNIWKESEYHEATKQNTMLLLQSERRELQCDPYFGVMLKAYLFSQNNYAMYEMLADSLYTQLALFIPQLKIDRTSIKVSPGEKLGTAYCSFSGISQIDYELKTYNLVLISESQE